MAKGSIVKGGQKSWKPTATAAGVTNSATEDQGRLYTRPIESRRTGPFYNAFSYPTKIDPEVIALFVATHTDPGDTVLDVFGGSGTTGIAVTLCDRPTARMRSLAAEYGVRPIWGQRRAIIYELSPLGALLSRVMCDPPNPTEFTETAEELLWSVEEELGWMYEAPGPKGEPGQIRYVIWSEVLRTQCCDHRLTLWEAAVKFDPARILNVFECQNCGSKVAVDDCERVVLDSLDQVIGAWTVQRERVPVQVYGRSGTTTWSRRPTDDDLSLIKRVDLSPLGPVPSGPIFWGDLHRAGYHSGIERFHQLYTPRNLRAISALWRQVGFFPKHLTDALRLLVLSFNATHSTLLTRVVAKKKQRELVVTGAQSGVLYISGLPVEKNVLEGVRRKIRTFSEAFRQTHGSRSNVRVVNASSTTLDLPDDSVDYLFTDPPFGDFIPYAEVNQINEAWLGRMTDRTKEVIVSQAQNKGISEYACLLREVFMEAARVLRLSGTATVAFHASKPAIWKAIIEAFRASGLAVERTSVLDKTQVSFKQVVSQGGTRGDALFLLRPRTRPHRQLEGDAEGDVEEMISALEAAGRDNPSELDPKRMYSRYVARCVELDVPVALSAPDFYRHLSRLRQAKGEDDMRSGRGL